MITNFEEFCTWAYVVIDDMHKGISKYFKRPGPEPLCSDSELLTMAIVGECRGLDQETELLSFFQDWRHLFPCIPSQSRFNRRRRALRDAFSLIRIAVLKVLDLAQDRYCLIDSLPIPVVQFHLVPSSDGDWKAHGASFGHIESKSMTIFGYKLHLLITFNGIILNFSLAPEIHSRSPCWRRAFGNASPFGSVWR